MVAMGALTLVATMALMSYVVEAQISLGCDQGMYNCMMNGRCIDAAQLCNGMNDCGDADPGSDETEAVCVEPFPGIPRYVRVGLEGTSSFPVTVMVTLDCQPYAESRFGRNINESSFRWFRETSEVFDNSTIRDITLSGNRQQLFIDNIRIASGSEDGTEAAYSCEVCSNPDPVRCDRGTTSVRARDPPVLTCPEPDNQIDFQPVLSIPLGCDVCVEFGDNATLASLLCQPSTTRVPVDCVIRSPEGLNPDQLADIDGFQVASPSQISMSGLLANPENPAPPRILGTWTCTCNNSDGVTVATSRLDSCLQPPRIDKGIEMCRNIRFPPYVSEGPKETKIGGDVCTIVGSRVDIRCDLLERGMPPARVIWRRGSTELPEFENRSMISINASEPTVAYTCEAMNDAGMDSATTNFMFATDATNYNIFQKPILDKSRPGPPPDDVPPDDMTVTIGEDMYILPGRTATVECGLSQEGIPPAPVRWTRRDFPWDGEGQSNVMFSGDGRILTISNISKSVDCTYYCCIAENAAGIDQACTNIICPGEPPLFRRGLRLPLPMNPDRINPGPASVDIGGSAYTTPGNLIEIIGQDTRANPLAMDWTWQYIPSGGTPTTITGTPMIIMMGGFEVSTFTDMIDGLNFTVFTNIPRKVSRVEIRGATAGQQFNISSTVTNVIGSDTATSNVAIYSPPVFEQGMPNPNIPDVIQNDLSPTVTIGETIYMTEGNSATINANLVPGSGLLDGTTDFEWYYKGERVFDDVAEGGRFSISTTPTGTSLTINDVTLSDVGQIQVIGYNPAGSDRAFTDLNVYKPIAIDKGDPDNIIGPDEPLKGKIGDTFNVEKGKRAFINCDLAESGGFPYNETGNLPAEIEWFRGTPPMPVDPSLYSGNHGNQLCVDVSSLADGGDFTCIATSRIMEEGTFQSDTATSRVNVLMGPIIDPAALPPMMAGERAINLEGKRRRVVEDGSTVRIRCSVMMSIPDANITWTFSNGRTTQAIEEGGKFTIRDDPDIASESELLISNFGSEDVGRYRCTASNSVGSDVASASIGLCPSDSRRCAPGEPGFTIELDVSGGFNDTCPFCAEYAMNQYGPCQPPCHLGIKTRTVICRAGGRRFENEICNMTSQTPPSQMTCEADFPDPNDRACNLAPRWKKGPWGHCSRTCDGGLQKRQVCCHIPATGKEIHDSECTYAPKPKESRRCNIGKPCGCQDFASGCEKIGGRRCAEEVFKIACCETCSQGGRSFPY